MHPGKKYHNNLFLKIASFLNHCYE